MPAADGRFRQDLYFRLAVVEVIVPPLRERREDIPALAREFARIYGERFGRPESRERSPPHQSASGVLPNILSTTPGPHSDSRLPKDGVCPFEAGWKHELAQRAATSPTADLDAAIARQAARVDRLAAAVGDAPDIGPLLAHLRDANARLGELRERRAKVAPTRPAPKMPSLEQIRGYFDGLVSTLEADPAAARDVLAAAFSSVRLVPTASAYRLELTMAEVCSKANCGGGI